MHLGLKTKDIAAAAKVSSATVSLVLNQKPGVAESTRRRVLQIAKSMGGDSEFQRYLTDVKFGKICFVKVVRHGRTLNRDHDVFIAMYLAGLDEEARLCGYSVEITALNASVGDGVDSVLNLMRRTNAAGFVVLGTELDERDIAQLCKLEFPLVFIDTHFDSESACFVNMDNAGSVFQAVAHLHGLGHRQIGYVRSEAVVQNFRLRDVAFHSAMASLGLPVAERDVFTVDSTFAGAYEDMRRHLRGRKKLPSALFFVNDITAYGSVKALKEKGVRIPEDVSVVGFDDLPMSAMFDPPLTTIHVMNHHIGRAAMRMLARHVAEGEQMPFEKIQVVGKLIVRKSAVKI